MVAVDGLGQRGAWVSGGFGSPAFGRFQTVSTRANHQPAVACYVQHPGDAEFRALAVDVLRIRRGRIIEIIAFDRAVFPSFGLPETVAAGDER